MSDEIAKGRPRPRRSGRARWAAAGILAVIAIVGFVVVTVAGKVVYGPEALANAYLDALAARDDDVFELLRPGLPVEQQALLTPAILASTDPVVTDAEVTDVRVDGDRAEITAEATIDDEPVTFDLVLERVGSRLAVLDDWRITDADLPTVTITAPRATALDVNGVSIDVRGLDDGLELAVFPGTYDITPRGDVPLSTYDAGSGGGGRTVLDAPETLAFELAPTPELATVVETRANEYLEACFAQTVPRPEGCPNRLPADVEADDITWDVFRPPTYDIVATVADDGSVSIEVTDTGTDS